MITASHLPYQRNGFKFFTAEGGLEKADIKDVLSRAAQAAAAAGVAPDNEFLGTAYVMTMALSVQAGLISQVCCAALTSASRVALKTVVCLLGSTCAAVSYGRRPYHIVWHCSITQLRNALIQL